LDATPAARRRRRTPEQGADFRNELIAAARELFASEGVKSVSIRRIAERAGCPTMTFYVYFRTKRELLYHIWGDVIGDARATCARAVDPGAPAKERLRAFLLAIVAYWLAHPDSYRIVYLSEAEPDDGRGFNDSLEEGGRLVELETLLEEAIRDGVFRPVDVIEVSQALYSASIGLAHLLITVPEYAWRRDSLDATTFDLLIRGLERSPAASDR
jgi:AcrR family transcriptional regulator